MIDWELVQTLRFFEGLGNPLSTWELEMLSLGERAETLRPPKAFEVRQASEWLRRHEEKRNGQRSYCSPGIYTVEHCQVILATDALRKEAI